MKAIDRAYKLAEKQLEKLSKASHDVLMARLKAEFFDPLSSEIEGYVEEMNELHMKGDEHGLLKLRDEIEKKVPVVNRLIDADSELNFKFG